MPRPKHIGFIGDIHCGSKYGLWPTEELGRKHTSARYLMECYEHLVKHWPDLDLLILMGDLIDGKQRKSDGVGLFTSDLGEQVAGAIEVLRPLAAKSRCIYRVEGTPYHEEFDNALSTLDVTLGVQKSAQVLDIDLQTGILNVAHHPSSSASLSAATIDRMGLWSKVATVGSKIPHARWIVRAHCHGYMKVDSEDLTIIQNPCFQLPTPHAKKINYYKFQSDIGGMLMIADDEEDSGYRFRCTTYPVPSNEVIRAPEAQAPKPSRRRKRAKGARGK